MAADLPDPETFRARERDAWNSVARAWRRWWPIFEAGAQTLNDRLVVLAGIEKGQRVLEIATGIGEPALTAAARVGPHGRVLATDLSPRMLELAVERAAAAGLDQVEFREMDATCLDLPAAHFDAATCRWGLMLLADPLAAARGVLEALRSGARFATATWSRPEEVPFLALPRRVVQRELDLPAADPEAPGPFRLCRPELLGGVLEEAGFCEVTVEVRTVKMSFVSAAEYVDFISEMSSSLGRLLEARPTAERERVRDAIGAEAGRYAAEDGRILFRNRVLCTSGRAPAP